MAQSDHYIANDSELQNFDFSTLGAGDHVYIADGTYASSGTIKISPATGTEAAPITITATNPGKVVFTNGQRMSIGGDHVIINGLYWNGGSGASNFIETRDGYNYANYTTIQNCAINGLTAATQSSKHRWIVLYGTYNNVVNCSFLNKANAGALILVELAYNASPDNDVTNTRCMEVGHTIANNYFYNFSKIPAELTNAGDSETIRVGTSEYQNVNANCVVTNNYFVQADGENEIITNKSKGNTYTNNTFRRCRGSLVLRHGSYATVQGNFFLGENVEGTGGIRIVDSNHIITDNYIQDCINVADQAKWNNGFTFLGGSTTGDVACASTSTSTEYQKALNNTVVNNTIVNTNAPVFFNDDKGNSDISGVFSNNLVYFDTDNANITPVISDDNGDGSAYNDINNANQLWSGNVYKGTTIGIENSGFALDNGITAMADGEIYAFSGVADKGADMEDYTLKTDAMVGYGIGACFLSSEGASVITNGDCSAIIPEPAENLTVGNVSALDYEAATGISVSVTANVSWSAVSNDAWITNVSPASGTESGTVTFSVSQNSGDQERVGTITFTQTSGDGTGEAKVLTVTQNGPEPRDIATLINYPGNNAVVVNDFSMEEVNGSTKFNYAVNVLDKNQSTNWSSDGTTGGDSFIIIDLGAYYDLEIVDFASTNGKTYDFQIRVSSTGTDEADFSDPFGIGNLISSSDNTFKSFVLPSVATATRFVKILGFGQPNGSGSAWTSITELEFYGELNAPLSTKSFDSNAIAVYPVPAKDVLNIKSTVVIDTATVYGLDGRVVIQKNVKNINGVITLNTTNLANGTYVIKFTNANGLNTSKLIMVSH